MSNTSTIAQRIQQLSSRLRADRQAQTELLTVAVTPEAEPRARADYKTVASDVAYSEGQIAALQGELRAAAVNEAMEAHRQWLESARPMLDAIPAARDKVQAARAALSSAESELARLLTDVQPYRPVNHLHTSPGRAVIAAHYPADEVDLTWRRTLGALQVDNERFAQEYIDKAEVRREDIRQK